MSNLIPKIKADIKAIEDTVDVDMSKEEVYDKLIKAYNLHKDIIALYEDSEMEIDTSTNPEEIEVLEARLRDADDIIFTARTTIANMQTEQDILIEQVRVLEAWKDGANLEGEQHVAAINTLGTQLKIAKASLESRDKLVENYRTVFDHVSQSADAAISELTNLQTMVNPNDAE